MRLNILVSGVLREASISCSVLSASKASMCQKLANQEFLARLWIAAANSLTEYIMEQLSDGNALDGSPVKFAMA